MELKELRYYRAIVELGSFSKAAAALRIAQPALSRHIQKLEHSLGVQLLRRGSRGVVPTPAGATLLARTTDLEHQVSLIEREISSYANNVVGYLNIAAMFPLSVCMMPDVVKRYREAYPDVTLHIVQGYSGDLIQGLLSRTLDLALVDSPSHTHAELTISPLWKEKVHLFGSAKTEKDNPLFQQACVELTQLANKPIVIPSHISVFRRMIDGIFSREKLKLAPVIEADGPEMIFEMVKAGIGYGLMPRCAIHERVKSGELLSVPTAPKLERRISIVTRAEIREGRLLDPLLTLIREAAKELVRTEPFETVQLLFIDD